MWFRRDPRVEWMAHRRESAGTRARDPGNLDGFRSRTGVTTSMHLSKLHATGNDFLVRLALDEPAGALDARAVAALCDRHRGIGADGLITIGPGRDGADCTMTLVNADGGAAEMSGNGIRCLAWVAARAGLARDDELDVDTAAGRRLRAARAARRRRSSPPTSTWDRSPSSPRSIPIAVDDPFDLEAVADGVFYRGDAAGMGNPHLVLFVDDPAAVPVTTHGPILEHDARFPRRTNVEFVARHRTPDRIAMRVWERGAGETLSCGTGACAVAAVAHRRELVGTRVQVDVLGGTLDGDARRHRAPRRSGGARLRRRGSDRSAARVFMSPSRSHQNRQRRRLTATEVDLERRQQRALLVGTGYGTTSIEEAEASLDELVLLTETAGADPVERVLQRRTTPDPATYIGKGKAEELRQLGVALDIDVVVFDDELTPAQQRNLEKLFKVDVVDRAALILDIFAQHATSQEGMIQVELAQLRYRLPRLRGRGLQLSQQAGGIGTRRGPGETQLEVDRRRLVRRVQKLEARSAQPSSRRARRSARPGAGASCCASRSSATRTRASRRC